MKMESQVKVELALESGDRMKRSKLTREVVRLFPDCLELSEKELLMVEYAFDFQNKFRSFEQHRLTQKRKKKNSVIIPTKEALEIKTLKH